MGVKLFDRFSFLHAMWGVISYTFGIRSFIIAVVLHTILEIMENSIYGQYTINTYLPWWPGMKPKGDTFTNILGDTISFSIGWWTAYCIFRIY